MHTQQTQQTSHTTHTHTHIITIRHTAGMTCRTQHADRESYIATVTRTGIFNQIERSFRDVLLFLKKGVSTI